MIRGVLYTKNTFDYNSLFSAVVSSLCSRPCSQPFPTAFLDCVSRPYSRPGSGPIPDLFPTHSRPIPDLFPTRSPIISRTAEKLFPYRTVPPKIGSRPVPYRQRIVSSRPIPSTKWFPTFPSHSRPAVNRREHFPVPPLGKTQKNFRLRRAKRSHPVPRGAFGTARTPENNHGPKETWGNMAKQKEGTDGISTANIIPKTITQMY